tara:strand:- start:1541 stop:2173 length:633 start_codon:yes stop_codon:yes gene_type:complete
MKLLEEYIKILKESSIRDYDPESYYYYPEPNITLQTIVDRWQKQRDGKTKLGKTMPFQKIYDDGMPIMINVKDLLPHREYIWTRENARQSFVKRGQAGPEKWDEIMDNMKRSGWDKKQPLEFYIGHKGGMKVGEGNHRLAIAQELDIEEVPVSFSFIPGTVRKSVQTQTLASKFKKTSIPNKSISSTISKPMKPLSPEEQKTVDNIMDMF